MKSSSRRLNAGVSKRALRSCLRVFAILAAGVLLLTLPVFSARAQSRAPRPRAVAATFLGPTGYLSKADSPFLTDLNAGNMYLEDFECGILTVPGVALSAGTIIPPGFEGLIDSVDADDGVIDGSGLGGHSLFSGDGATGITFTFNQTTLGAFPTKAGIVWTDGGGVATFEAFDSVGASLGTIVQDPIGDASNSGETAEDRFFGAINAGGIQSFQISISSSRISCLCSGNVRTSKSCTIRLPAGMPISAVASLTSRASVSGANPSGSERVAIEKAT